MLFRSRATGRAESREIINELTKRLIQEGRMEDLKRSLDDHAYQDQMLKEYGLEYMDNDEVDIRDSF